MKYSKLQEFFSEFFGTFIIILFGCGSVAMVTLFPSGEQAVVGEVIKGGYTNVVFGWALGVAFGIIISLRISGAHLNPAISIALVLTNNFPYKKLPQYILAQLTGAMSGAMLVFLVFYSRWIQIDPNFINTQGVLTTFPAVSGFFPGFFDQIIGTFFLMFLILGCSSYFKDPTNNIAFPFVIASIVLAIGISLGGMNGYAINPARDLGPRIILYLLNFKYSGFEEFRVWFVPIVGPIIGAYLGAIMYRFLFQSSKN